MTVDIAKSIFRTLAQEGAQFSEGFFKTLSNIYLKIAQETVVLYENDAEMNSLKFDRHNESVCVEAFAEGIKRAGEVFWENPSGGEVFWENPSGTVLIPNWHRVIAALPDFLKLLRDAVKEDNEQYAG
jgi:glucosyl-3-phosphoglycerate synthase